MKRFLLSTAILGLTSSLASAFTIVEKKIPGGTDIKVDFNLYGDFGGFNTYGLGDQKTGLTLFSQVGAAVSIVGDNGMVKYGATYSLATNTASSRCFDTHAFVEAGIAKVVVGSDKFAGGKLKIDGTSVQVGSPCMSIYQYPSDSSIKKWADGVSLVSLRERPGCERARNAAIYLSSNVTSEGKITAGLSYAPNDANMGSATSPTPERRAHPFINNLSMTLEDVYSFGVKYEHKIGDFTVAVSGSYENAKPKLYRKTQNENGAAIEISPSANLITSLGLKDFRTLGAGIMIGSEYLDASFGFYSMHDSLTIPKVTDVMTTDQKTYAYSFGVAGKFNDFNLGFVFTNGSNALGATVTTYNISAQYSGLTGVTPYVSYEKYTIEAKQTVGFKDISKTNYVTADDIKDKSPEDTAKIKADKVDAMFDNFKVNKPEAKDAQLIQNGALSEASQKTNGHSIAVGIKVGF